MTYEIDTLERAGTVRFSHSQIEHGVCYAMQLWFPQIRRFDGMLRLDFRIPEEMNSYMKPIDTRNPVVLPQIAATRHLRAILDAEARTGVISSFLRVENFSVESDEGREAFLHSAGVLIGNAIRCRMSAVERMRLGNRVPVSLLTPTA